MSYPWYRFQVTFEDGYVALWSATGIGQTDAMRELLSFAPEGKEDIYDLAKRHGEVIEVKYLHFETFGLDPESDKILLEEANKRSEANK